MLCSRIQSIPASGGGGGIGAVELQKGKVAWATLAETFLTRQEITTTLQARVMLSQIQSLGVGVEEGMMGSSPPPIVSVQLIALTFPLEC